MKKILLTLAILSTGTTQAASEKVTYGEMMQKLWNLDQPLDKMSKEDILSKAEHILNEDPVELTEKDLSDIVFYAVLRAEEKVSNDHATKTVGYNGKDIDTEDSSDEAKQRVNLDRYFDWLNASTRKNNELAKLRKSDGGSHDPLVQKNYLEVLPLVKQETIAEFEKKKAQLSEAREVAIELKEQLKSQDLITPKQIEMLNTYYSVNDESQFGGREIIVDVEERDDGVYLTATQGLKFGNGCLGYSRSAISALPVFELKIESKEVARELRGNLDYIPGLAIYSHSYVGSDVESPFTRDDLAPLFD